MRSLPVDSNRIRMIGTGAVRPVTPWIDGPDGRRVPGVVQETDDQGRPLWEVEVMAPGGPDDRAEVISVRVPAPQAPVVAEFAPVAFHGLWARVGVNKTSGKATQYWSAEGVQAQGRGQEKAA